MADTKSDKSEALPTDLLGKFLGDFEQLPKLMLEGMLQQAESEDEKEVLRNLGGVLTSQISELTVYIRERGGRLTAQQRQDTDQILRLSAAVPMVASGGRLASNLAPQVAKIGLVGIIQEIKKIIRLLLEAFNIKIPKWLDLLLLLIDQLVNLFTSTGAPALANTFSRMEQNYLAELTHHYRLQRETDRSSDLEEEERG